MAVRVWINLSGRLESHQRGFWIETTLIMPRRLIIYKLSVNIFQKKMVGGQPPVNVRGVVERHNIVRQTYSGFGVDARVGPGRSPRDLTRLCLSGLFLTTFVMGRIPRAGSWHA